MDGELRSAEHAIEHALVEAGLCRWDARGKPHPQEFARVLVALTEPLIRLQREREELNVRYVLTLANGSQIATDFEEGRPPRDVEGRVPAGLGYDVEGFLHIVGTVARPSPPFAPGDFEGCASEYLSVNRAHIVSVRDTDAG